MKGGGRAGVQRTGHKVTGQRSQEEGGARSNVGRIQDDTTTPQNHNHNAATSGRGRGSNEELKEKQNKVKINSSEHYESDYRRAE